MGGIETKYNLLKYIVVGGVRIFLPANNNFVFANAATTFQFYFMLKRYGVRVSLWILFIGFFVCSCATSRNARAVRKNLAAGYASCNKELLTLTDQQTIDNHISFLGSHPDGIIAAYTGKGYIYDKKFNTVPGYYDHTFRLTYDSLINFEFTLVTDSTGQFSKTYNSKYRDYTWLIQYFKMINSKEELDRVLHVGTQYFGDNRFTISFARAKEVDYSYRSAFTEDELFEIRKNKWKYELVDRDEVRESSQKFRRKGIVVDPQTKKIISETMLVRTIVY